MSLTRRECLRALLAGSVAGSCRRNGRTIGGSIVGGASARGHLLREGARPAATSWEETTVVIAGGGVAGLSAAWALARAGLQDFVVLELEEAAGGTARSGQCAVTPYPWGAHYVPIPDPANAPMVELLDEVGAVAGRGARGEPEYAEDVLCRDPQERLFYRGEWYEGLYPRVGASARDLRELEAFEEEMRSWACRRGPDGRRAFAAPRAFGSAGDGESRKLDGISMEDYLASRGFHSERLRWYVEYACRDDFGAALSDTSAWAGVQYFASRIPESGVEPVDLLSWPEGNGRLVNHLARVSGDRVRTGALVTDVVQRGDGVDATYVDASGQARGIRARHGVLAVPRFLARRIVAPYRDRLPEHAGAEVVGPWMVANLTLSDRPQSRGFPLAWDNVLYGSPSLGYVVATHQSGKDIGATVLTYYYPFLGDPGTDRTAMLATPWEQWVDLVLRDLGPAHPGMRELVERVDVYLWGHAMVRPVVGSMWNPGLAEAARPLGRLRFAHTDLSGMALFEEAQHWGLVAARSILDDEGLETPAWLSAGGAA